MGQRSIKENKNYYFQSREKANLTREVAADTLGISKSRLEKIEYDKSLPYPEEAKAMATCYKNPSLCNYYCSHDCEIGKDQVAEIKEKSLSQISLEMLSTLNELSNNKERFINIVADEVISHDEMEDFNTIKENLHKMSLIVDSLNLWIEKTSIANEDN
ncbi:MULTISPECIES: helix-turn-helix transcriptional regulator [Breznakia]|uniref:Helix-turn-helix protein n=1 Tax=Breznakia blatticola TaxID=1754012 RepID=A0A4R8A5V0_9FIRM|nr:MULTISPECIES: helix-turn-helix transcriptional regulator [Breznakia]MDH6367314.1 transcriptional regulator with XRE-family HTH domain [Breznakia sp. PH1-1]MDH6404538.1 transcriptional regulator with XRE-family HTH domain [Breznakia sp. PF1-11]MDH6412247.1 transcriptional regulator with XRE-family HTH domain [Breznakia sp. PFB1-11]MDH6414481.1 transcriptional regulator with XRE-family HTH domain [Breznakia sp. PFB1-14]MDH6416911.1 transcriptional regulator with XRE-family HTH domain [Breznak